MTRLRASDVARICGGRLVGDADEGADGFEADSRKIVRGQGFVAVGDRHAFVADAFAAGAAFAIVSDETVLPEDATGVVVASTQDALWALAREVRSRLGVRVVGITGSTGKTLTKDLVAAAASARFRVHAAPGSYNNEVGVPLVVLSCPDRADVLVCEMGARHRGDVADLARIVAPEIGIVTGIGITHLGIFGDRETIARSKAELLASLPASGRAIVPAADDFLDVLCASTAAAVTTVGPGGHVRVEGTRIEAEGVAADVRIRGERVGVRLRLAGRVLTRNAAMALAAADALAVPLEAAAGRLASAEVSSWRMQIRSAGGRTLVNDAYNANPTSVSAALRSVAELAGGREHWAVLGQMAELGDAAEAEHVRVGRLARALGFRVLAVGDATEGVSRGADSEHVEDAAKAARLVDAQAAPDAVVLVKGSRVAGLERCADLLVSGSEVGG